MTISIIFASMLLIGFSTDTYAAIYVKIPGLQGDVTTKGYEGYFTADSFSFGVEREMKESGEKGGTQDINIGIGELQECTISKSLDSTSSHLAQFAINGNSPGTAEIDFVEVGGSGEATTYLKYKLDRVFVKSWSTSGDADDRPTEEVTFVYTGLEEFSENSKILDPVESQEEMSPETIDLKNEKLGEKSNMLQKPRVPNWIQMTSTFWVEGDVTDREFTDSIGFLVKEKIIKLDKFADSESQQETADPKVPSWIKESTKWWIEGQITEDQFLDSIKWLIKNNIIRGISN